MREQQPDGTGPQTWGPSDDVGKFRHRSLPAPPRRGNPSGIRPIGAISNDKRSRIS